MATDRGGSRYSNFPTFLGGTGGSGTDEFGDGVDLEHGWSAVATVSSDAPGYDIDGVASIAPGVSHDLAIEELANIGQLVFLG